MTVMKEFYIFVTPTSERKMNHPNLRIEPRSPSGCFIHNVIASRAAHSSVVFCH